MGFYKRSVSSSVVMVGIWSHVALDREKRGSRFPTFCVVIGSTQVQPQVSVPGPSVPCIKGGCRISPGMHIYGLNPNKLLTTNPKRGALKGIKRLSPPLATARAVLAAPLLAAAPCIHRIGGGLCLRLQWPQPSKVLLKLPPYVGDLIARLAPNDV